MSLSTESIPSSQPVPATGQGPNPIPGRRVQYSPSDLMAVLNELGDLLGSAKPFMLSKDIRVNRDVALGLIDELKGALPVAVEHADEALTQARNHLASASQQADSLATSARAEADAILASAKSEADVITANARQRQQELVEQEAVVTQAKARAASIIAAAEQEAEQLRTDADAYADASLAQLGNDLAHLQSQVAAGRARLVERHPQLAGQPTPAQAPQPPRAFAAQQTPARQSVQPQAKQSLLHRIQPQSQPQPQPQGQPRPVQGAPSPQR